MKHRIIIKLSLVIMSFSLPSLAELRIWTGLNGSKVEAELISQNKNEVTLTKEDGKTIIVPIAKLSKVDRIYLNKKILVEEQDNDEEYYALKVILESTDKSAHISISSPWNKHFILISETCPSFEEAREKNLPPPAKLEDWGFERTLPDDFYVRNGENVPSVRVEYVLYLSSDISEDLIISIEGTGVIEVNGLNPVKGKMKEIETFTTYKDGDIFEVQFSKIKKRASLVKHKSTD